MIRVGYVPYSKNLLHPADRRRIAAWAAEKKIELNTSNPLNSDILIISNAANFGYWLKRAKQPVILDLVDGYLGENPSFLKDFVRNILRSFKGLSSIYWGTYTRHLRYACRVSQTVIVASPEQRELVLKFNKNVHVILDDHSEIDSRVVCAAQEVSTEPEDFIFWEGFGFTLKHFKFMAPDLDRFLEEFNWGLILVTVEKFSRWGGYLGKIKTRDVVKALFPKSWQSIKVIPWSLDNVVMNACKSSFAIIPISPKDKFANFKSENKLLSMWHLRLPTLTSPTPAYKRVLSNAGASDACVIDGDWYERLSSFAISHLHRKHLASSGTDYVLAHHTRDELVKKWDKIISLTLYDTKV